ncbi:energy transducer TonB, partial [Serratia nevei]|uniref:energy transducer TonB n=1 Tax=Serratia nevei TaxID=2703794 RepID=UPI003FA6958C
CAPGWKCISDADKWRGVAPLSQIDMMNRQHLVRSGISLLISTALHGAVMLMFLYVTVSEPANSVVLQGKVAALTIHMVSASLSETARDEPAEPAHLATAQGEDKVPPLPSNTLGRHHPIATKLGRKTVLKRSKPLAQREKSEDSPTVKTGQHANRGQDRQESEEGIAVQTSQLPMIGSGADENAAYAARLRSEIESHKRYPLRARQARSGGVVSVRFNVKDDGRLTDPQLISSSGNQDLDKAALLAVQQSNSVGPRPQSFSRSVNVKINFVLKNR